MRFTRLVLADWEPVNRLATSFIPNSAIFSAKASNLLSAMDDGTGSFDGVIRKAKGLAGAICGRSDYDDKQKMSDINKSKNGSFAHRFLLKI